MKIYYEQVEPLDPQMKDSDTVVYKTYDMTVQEIQEEITILVDTLHSLGYGHGDLHMGNIGFKNGRFYLLDHDTVYKVSEGRVPWLNKWIVQYYDDQFDSFDEFVQYDYDNWKSDWLS
jgi:predicted unusual protein kinase regulating ubiquinone biosynthesis (AarF/ABC1/UbiB family)